MRKVLLLLILPLLSTLSCQKDEKSESSKNTCSVTDPAQDLPWLQSKIALITSQDSSYAYIQQAVYQGQTVFIFRNCCPSCNTIVPVYNCQGEIICTLYSQACPNLLEEISHVKTIAKAKKTLCNL
jgi:hypothetical protein